jgi:hypothetical protein
VLDLTNVPTVDDFSIALNDRRLEFVDGNGKRLAWFPAWENADRDLKHFIATDVPLGTIDAPYEDFDDAWRIAILEHEGFVYVLEGDDPHAETFPRRFRVPRDTYIRAWAVLITEHNPIDLLDGPV